MPAHTKFKFCFLELSGIFFRPNIFYPWLLESVDAELVDTEGQLYTYMQITAKEAARPIIFHILTHYSQPRTLGVISNCQAYWPVFFFSFFFFFFFVKTLARVTNESQHTILFTHCHNLLKTFIMPNVISELKKVSFTWGCWGT